MSAIDTFKHRIEVTTRLAAVEQSRHYKIYRVDSSSEMLDYSPHRQVAP